MASSNLTRDKNRELKTDVITIPAADMDTDGSGDIVVTFDGLREVLYANLVISTGFIANFLSVSGNAVTFRVFWTGAVVDTALAAADSETDIGLGRAIGVGY